MASLLQKVFAQADPSFPYDGPFEEPEQPDTSQKATIKLTNGASSIEVGSTTTADITIETDNQEVVSYSITISFDPAVLEVVDKSSSQNGVQIDFLDSFATEKTNTTDNSEGVIKLNADITGSAQTVNRRIGQITFKGKSAGASVVSVNKSQSSVRNESNENILGTTTSLNLTVTGQSQQEPEPEPEPEPEQPQPQPTPPGELPSSGIGDVTTVITALLIASVMILIGMRTLLARKIRNIQ